MNGLIRCAHCGKLYMRGSVEMTYVDGHFICADCLDEAAFICEHCGEYHLSCYETNVYHSDGSAAIWCTDCANTDAYQCSECGEFFADHICGEDTVNGFVCDSCVEDLYTVCESCGRLIPRTEAFIDDWGNVYCAECSRAYPRSENAQVRSYHDAPSLQFIGDCLPTWNGLWRGVGIELEVDREDRDDDALQRALNRIDEIAGEHLHFEHDGSLNYGFEIVTQPHTVSAFYEMPWEEILEICRDEGFDSHDIGTCGLHMHFSREMFGADEETQSDNIAKLLQFFELYWNDVLKVSRRTESQADSWASRYNTVNKTRLKEHAKGDRYSGRYMAINLTNDSTVEIRIMRGTLNYDSFMACCDFMITAVNNSCRIGWSDTTDDCEWLVGIKENTKTYLMQRGAFYESVRRLG